MRTLRVGLTGGIGAGKSAVAERWRERGALIVDGDVLAREVVAAGSDGLCAIAERWPNVVRDGVLDRAALAAIVFADESERGALNAIVHPRVRARAADAETAAAPGTIVVHVIPLLFEGDYWRQCDATVVVIAPHEARVARVMQRDSVSRAEVERRMRAQIDPERARALASEVIENDGDRTQLRARADAVYDRLVERAREGA